MVTDRYSADQLSAGSDVDVAAKAGNGAPRIADGDLLKQQTVWPDFGVRVDDYAVGMRNQKPSRNFAAKRYVCASYH